MVSTREPGGARSSVVDLFPTKHLAAPKVRDMPEPPANFRHVIGPGIVAAGVGMASGEFILYPYIASQVGLVFVWAAFVGLATQYFLNMEIERYTLATGETALTGFSRYWRHWGLVFAILAYFAKDRKSTRLNSSHANISYAVFCLKKKKINYALLSFL